MIHPSPNELQLTQIPQHGNKNFVIWQGFVHEVSKDSLMDQGLMLALLFTSRHRQIGTWTTSANLALTVTRLTLAILDSIIHCILSKVENKVFQTWKSSQRNHDKLNFCYLTFFFPITLQFPILCFIWSVGTALKLF